MPAPEREVQPQSSRSSQASQAGPPSVSAVSMKDLLASCAAATAVSTPPSDERADEDAEAAGNTERDAA
ncbi:hypothetical protein ACIREO_10625 [Streptomyces sp. NPDC102441]|uniref:hypothetical protein n=1 Tax=Streptomyces sp. NPDC102441 TaxID=3366176 RepID=UPI0037F709D5